MCTKMPLACVAPHQFGVDEGRDFFVAKVAAVGAAPAARGVGLEPGRYFAGKALDDDVGTKSLEEVAEERNIIGKRERVYLNGFGIVQRLQVLLLEGAAFEDLQLMEFEGIDRQLAEDVGLVEHLFATLAWKSQDEMPPTVDSSFGGGTDGPLCGAKVVTPIYAQECGIIAALDAVFECNIMRLGKGGDVVQFGFIDAVGTRANDKSVYQGM